MVVGRAGVVQVRAAWVEKRVSPLRFASVEMRFCVAGFGLRGDLWFSIFWWKTVLWTRT